MAARLKRKNENLTRSKLDNQQYNPLPKGSLANFATDYIGEDNTNKAPRKSLIVNYGNGGQVPNY